MYTRLPTDDKLPTQHTKRHELWHMSSIDDSWDWDFCQKYVTYSPGENNETCHKFSPALKERLIFTRFLWPRVAHLLLIYTGTRLVTSEKRGRESRLQQTLWVIVSCTTVPLVAALMLVAVRCAVQSRRRDTFTQRHITTKSFADHVIRTTGNGSQQLALGYMQQQVDFIRLKTCYFQTASMHTPQSSAHRFVIFVCSISIILARLCA